MAKTNIRKYFNRKRPVGPLVTSVCGIIIIWLASNLRNGLAWEGIGLILLIVGAYKIYMFLLNQSDNKIDLLCEQIAKNYFREKRTEIILKTDKEMEKYESFSYSFENLFSFRKAIKGKDGIYRSTILDMSSLYLVGEKAYFYNKKISLVSDEYLEEQKEFGYYDIEMITIKNNGNESYLVITILGNEKIVIKMKSKEEAFIIYEKFQKRRDKQEL